LALKRQDVSSAILSRQLGRREAVIAAVGAHESSAITSGATARLEAEIGGWAHRLHAGEDTFAREASWIVSGVSGGPGFGGCVYRDPPFGQIRAGQAGRTLLSSRPARAAPSVDHAAAWQERSSPAGQQLTRAGRSRDG